MLINFLEAPILALILGYFTKYISGTENDPTKYIFSQNDNIAAYLFMAVVVALFLGLNVSAEEIIKDKKLLQREKFLNLSRSGYLNSKIMIMFGISAIQTLCLVLIGNSILEIKGLNFSYWMILFSTACFSNMLGLNISSGLKSVVAIYILIPLILVPQLLFSGVIVDFNKLHKSIATSEYVPRIGDFMTSRWAYEALAVNQFVNNEYEKHFFEDEQKISESSYYYALLLPRLKQHNLKSKKYFHEGDTDAAQANLNVIKVELAKISKSGDLDVAQLIVGEPLELNEDRFDKLQELLDKMIVHYQDKYNKYKKHKDKTYEKLAGKLGGSEGVFQLKEEYYNSRLAAILLNKGEFKQLVYTADGYLQQKDPVLRNGTSDRGRAHFYAPNKKYFGFVIPTTWFNILVIWFSTILLYLALYFDLLQHVIRYFEKFQLRKAFTRQINKV